jgi:hypothetical protein
VSVSRRIHATRWVLTSNPGREPCPEDDDGSFEAFTSCELDEDVSCSVGLCADFPYELLYIVLEDRCVDMRASMRGMKAVVRSSGDHRLFISEAWRKMRFVMDLYLKKMHEVEN